MSTTEAQNSVNSNLQKQDLNNLDISNLTPLSPEVISRQATINIGTIGHVAHGKSTVVKAISGVQTVRFKNELERNITIKLERLSQERISELLKSPKSLRQYEEKVAKKLRLLARERKNKHIITMATDLLTNNSNGTASRRTTPLRSNSISPSSGYESLNDNASSCSSEYLTPRSRWLKNNTKSTTALTLTQSLLRQHQEQDQARQCASKRCLSQSSSPLSGSAETSYSKKRKTENANKADSNQSGKEYVVESIESLESINGNPVFYVKWFNYPADENTWESLANLSECALLDQFVENLSTLYEGVIASITAEIETEIELKSLTYDVTKLNVGELDEYDPLELKIYLLLLVQMRESRSRSVREPEKIRNRIVQMMLVKPFYYLRKQQLVDLGAWQMRMNLVEQTAPITIENNVDLDVLDHDFQYIKESFPGVGVEILKDPPIGCKCVGGCVPLAKCCARMADSYFAYDKNGRLRIRAGEAIYECNSKCACDENCVNRVIQRGRNNALCLFKTANGCGWGVRTERLLRKGEYVCEYVGEIITTDEANERGKKYDAIGRTYLFDLDYNMAAESVYTIDAALHGNISHFINHSCDPNLAVFPFWINNLDINMPRLAFFSLRPIKAGEELTFDYIRNDMGDNEYQNLSVAAKVSCRCGAENCRKVLF